MSQYRAFIEKLRLVDGVLRDDWVHFLISHYERQCRPEHPHLFRYACRCLPPIVSVPPKFDSSVPDSASDKDSSQYAVRSLQLSYLTERGPSLIIDRKCSIWDFLKRSGPRRADLIEKLEGSYKKSVLHGEGLPLFLDISTATVGRSPTSSSSPSSGLNLGRVSVTVSRCTNEDTAGVGNKHKTRAIKGQKN